MLQLVIPSLAVLAFAVAGLINLAGTATLKRDFARWGYPTWWHRVTGLLEIATAALIAWPYTRVIGLAVGSVIIFAAAGTVVHFRDYSHLRPIGVFVVLLAATTALFAH